MEGVEMMRYFKDDKEQIRAIDTDQEFLIQDSWLELESDENNKPYKAYMPDGTPDGYECSRLEEEAEITAFRAERDANLLIVDHYQKPLVWADLTDAQKDDVTNYRYALLDATESMVMPEKPIWFM